MNLLYCSLLAFYIIHLICLDDSVFLQQRLWLQNAWRFKF